MLVMSSWLTACNNLRTTKSTFMDINTGETMKNLSTYFTLSLKQHDNGQFAQRPKCMYLMHNSCVIKHLLEWTVSNKACR
jgi:hypothetical protein